MGRNNQQRRRMKSKARKDARRANHTADGGLGPDISAAAPWPPGSFWQPAPAPSLAEEARELVDRAVWAAHLGGEAVESALGHLLRLAGSDQGRRAVRRELTTRLRGQVSWAWRHGWQPADLHRFAARGARDPAVPILADAMVDELTQYAAGTVDQRWHAQLREVEAVRWWPQDSDYLEARAASVPGGWSEMCSNALAVLHLLTLLPVLEVLGPLPGQATAADRAAAERARAVDDRLLSKVRALLAKAESTTFEAEAETFTAGAQALMARHSIDVAMLAATEAPHDGPEAVRVGLDRPYEGPKAMLLDAVAGANRCRTVWSKELGFATVLGFTTDLRAVETLFTSLLVQATQAMRLEGSRRTAWGQSRTRSFRQSFLTSYAARIGERLRDVTQAEVDSASESPFQAGVGGQRAVSLRGRELVPVLAARDQEVDDATDRMFPELVQRTVSRVRDAEGWRSGRSAADQASLASFESLDRAE